MIALGLALALGEPALVAYRSPDRDAAASEAAIEAVDAITSDEPTQLSSMIFDGSGNSTDWRVFSNKHDCTLIFGSNFDSHHLSLRFDAQSKRSTIFIDDIELWAVEDNKNYELFVSYESGSGRENFRNQFVSKKLQDGAQLSYTIVGEMFLDIFSRSQNIGFWAPTGESIRVYDLKFGQIGVESLRRCAKLQAE